jgi:hypothetical protein|tara:strand:+ start:91 stop:393 length:303 start_codon:yes stop_codon:yes gene_type:complete
MALLVLLQILTVIFWVSVIWAVWAVNQKDRKKKEVGKGILRIAGIILIVVIIVGGGITLFNKGSGFLSDREYKKERCINETRNIENEFTAKKLYKVCMKR